MDIDDFYSNPTKISDNNIKEIEKLLDNNKRDVIENKYILFIADNDTIVKLFILFLYYFAFIIKNSTRKIHCAIDFEFNKGKIALMQLNFGKYVWIVDPKDYDKDKIKIINKKLLLNNNIYKVLHGADSLDLPYVFSELFYNDKDNILRFMGKFIDTRFLCEYVRSSKSEEGKCSIYNAMLYFNTITQDKFDELELNNKKMGPIQNIMWDIKKLNKFHIKYAFYDVLYLLTFLKDIYAKIINETPNLIRTYYYINQILRFVILERKNVTDILNISRKIVNTMNNYIMQYEGSNMTLLAIYNNLMESCIVTDNNKGYIDFNFIESVNYIKGTFNFLLKHIVYYICSKRHEIYKNKKETFNDVITLDELYDELNKNKMYKIINLLKLYEKHIFEKII